jgi:nicotinate-nucleotide--dimethylbenzimidazole phosphoribosyltransferase
MREAETVTNTPATPAETAPPPPGVDLAEIAEMVRHVLPEMPPVTAGGDKLGKYTDVWRWMAAAQYKQKPDIRHPRIALFMAPHGAYPEKQTGLAEALKQLSSGTHALSPLAQDANADLQVYEMASESAPRDFRQEAALLAPDAAHATSYGLMAVQPGIDLLVVAALNPAAENAGEKILESIKSGTQPLEALLNYGGLDIAAIMGALIAARLAHIPVLLDGKGAAAAAAILQALRADASLHTRNAAHILEDKLHPQAGMGGALLIAFLKSLTKVG